MRKIRLFQPIEMKYTPFDRSNPSQHVAASEIEFVDDVDAADIIISSHHYWLAKHGNANKRFVIWTHEPRWSPVTERLATLEGIAKPVHVMNAFTGLIYQDPYYYLYPRNIDFDIAMRAFEAKPRRGLFLGTYYENSEMIIGGRNIDLYQPRQELAVYMQENHDWDIYGKNWPKSVRISGQSRDGAWHSVKAEILKGYRFNLAYESTDVKYYVTEKLWDAVVNLCLPIYYAGENIGIYDVFPRDSFIDGHGRSPEEIADLINAMSEREVCDRFAECLRAYERSKSMLGSRSRVSERSVEFIREVMDQPLE